MAAQVGCDPSPVDVLLHGEPHIGIRAKAVNEHESTRSTLSSFAMPELHILRSRPAQNGSRSLRLAILPGPVLGSCSVEKSTDLGIL